MHDTGSGLDVDSLRVVADFPVGGVAAGENLASKFKSIAGGVWEWKLSAPLVDLAKGKLDVSVKDKQGQHHPY